MKKNTIPIILFILISLLFPSLSNANVVLSWDPNTEPDLGGYKVYYGTSSRNYTTTIDVKNVTTYTAPWLGLGTYYFALKAYDIYGVESTFSTEVSTTLSANQPPSASGDTGGGTLEITSPAPQSTLSGSSQAFNWTAGGTAVTNWWLWAGPCNSAVFGGCGQYYYNSGSMGSGVSSRTATGLPTDGSTVYLTLWYKTGGSWYSVVYQYTASGDTGGGTLEITSPAPQSTLSGSSQAFNWTAGGTAVTNWWLWVGTSQGGQDIFNSGDLSSSTSTTVYGLPTYGSTVYVTLWYLTGGAWESSYYQYTAYSGGGGLPPDITSPVPWSTLSGSSQTFNWTDNGTSVTNWWLWAGPCNSDIFGGCGQYYYNSGSMGSGVSSRTATGLPTDGSTVYVTLWYKTGGSWYSVVYQYTAPWW